MFMAALCPALLSAQEVASLTGVVTDSTGAVVPDVAVKLVDTRTNTSYEATTNSVGAYFFARLSPGPGYKMTFLKEGFEAVSIADIYLAVSSTHTQNAQLTVGTVNQSVEVNGSGSEVTLDTTDTSIGNNFDMRTVHDLPVIFRDSVAALLQYQPGVVAAASPWMTPTTAVPAQSLALARTRGTLRSTASM